MKLLERTERKYLDVKRQYGELIDSRLEMLKRGEFEGKPEGKGFFPEERKLFKRSDKLRILLLELKPEKYHYGRMNTDYISLKNGRKHSQMGDNGFFICEKCKKLFRHRGCSVELRKNESKESFVKCSEHRGRKEIGILTLKKEEE